MLEHLYLAMQRLMLVVIVQTIQRTMVVRSIKHIVQYFITLDTTQAYTLNNILNIILKFGHDNLKVVLINNTKVYLLNNIPKNTQVYLHKTI